MTDGIFKFKERKGALKRYNMTVKVKEKRLYHDDYTSQLGRVICLVQMLMALFSIMELEEKSL
jgi:hypothetical protein